MIDNLFIVESPLQALIAVELSLKFSAQNNGIIYRLSGLGRERNDNQMRRVIDMGEWNFREPILFAEGPGLLWHINARKYILTLNKRFRKKVQNLFFGEFRSNWMLLARSVIAPEKHILIDDGAATLTVKKQYLDKGIFYPKNLYITDSLIKNIVLKMIYSGILVTGEIRKPVAYASAFLKDESEFNIDFSWLKLRTKNQKRGEIGRPHKAYFFGSKYSEVGILSQNYELEFLSKIFNYYQLKGLNLVYCAHRDESIEKLNMIRRLGQLEVVSPELPAEVFILEHHEQVAEIGAAYSSVINNLSIILPDKPIVSFRLRHEAINPRNRNAIENIYQYFEKQGISVMEI